MVFSFILFSNIIRSQNISSGDFELEYKNKFYDSQDTFISNFRVVFFQDLENFKLLIFDRENKLIRLFGDSNIEIRFNQNDTSIKYYKQNDFSRYVYTQNNLVKLAKDYFLSHNFSSQIYLDSNLFSFQIIDPYKLDTLDGIQNENYSFTINLKDSIFTHVYSYLEEGENYMQNEQINWQMDEITIKKYKINHLNNISFQQLLDSVKISLPYRTFNHNSISNSIYFSKALVVGDKFPNIKALSLITKDSFQINENKGNKLIFFSFYGCSPCKVSFDLLNRNKSMITSPVIILNPVDKNIEFLREKLNLKSFPTNYGIIEKKISNQIGIEYFPTIFLVDSNQIIISKYNDINNNNIKEIVGFLGN